MHFCMFVDMEYCYGLQTTLLYFKNVLHRGLINCVVYFERQHFLSSFFVMKLNNTFELKINDF